MFLSLGESHWPQDSVCADTNDAGAGGTGLPA